MTTFKHDSIHRAIGYILHDYFKSWCLIVLILSAFTSVSCAQAPGDQSDINWLINVLNLDKGSIVAEIGAGDGDETIAVAHHIAPNGYIYSSELGPKSLEELRTEIDQAKLSNVTIIEGHPIRTNLPKQCCDAIYMRRVYHHFDDPVSMNKSLWESLKPGGRLAIIDFEPRGSEAQPEGRDSGSQHGVTLQTVIRELEKAGFAHISSANPSGRNVYLVMEKSDSL